MGLDLNYKAEVFVDTENLSREDWLFYRRKGIGGSDAAAIMGMSPFCTKRDLYYDKLGIQAVMDEEEDNWVAKEVGHRLEDLVAEIFSRKTGLKVYPIRKMFRHPLYPFMLADVDFFIEFPDGSTGILECKTTNYNCQSKWANDSTPVNYEYQGRHYMAVMNVNRMYFACLYGNNENEFIIRYMERDFDIEEDLIAEEEFFWKENVEKGVEPPYTEKPDLVLESIRKHCGPADKDADAVKLDRKYLASIRQYLELKEQKALHEGEAKKLDEKMKETYAEIVEEMGTSCTGVLRSGSDEYVVSYNPAYRTGIDKKGLERLKVHHPDVYDDYVNKKSGYTVAAMSRNYFYQDGGTDSIDLAALLPKDCGTVSYGTPAVSGNVTYSAAPAVSGGKLSYTLDSGSVNDAGTMTVTVATQNYADITVTVNVKLTDQIPVSLKTGTEVTLENNILTYGEPLSKLAFNEAEFVTADGESVTGTLAWKEAAATPNAGTASAVWIFTPVEDKYASLEGTAAITVNKAVPTVSAVPTVADRIYNPSVTLKGDDLTGATVTGVDGNTLKGGWNWQSADIVSTVNNNGYAAIFTPEDTTNYETVTRTITVNVAKATPYMRRKAKSCQVS